MMKYMFRLIAIIVLVGAGFARPITAQSSLTVSVLPAYNQLRYGKNNIRSSGDFDVGFSLTFRTRLTNNLQLAIGVNYRNYNGFIDFNGMRDSAHFTEPSEGHRYFLFQIFDNTETQNVTYIEPNIRLEFIQNLTPAIDFIAGIGLGFGIHFTENNAMTSGTFRRYAYFYDIHVLIENFPAMGLTTFSDFQNPLSGNTFGHSLFALAHVGFQFQLSPRWQFLALLNVQHSLLNIQNNQDVFIHHESYSGITASDIPGGVHAFSAGLELGFAYRFGTVQRQARPAHRGLPCPPGQMRHNRSWDRPSPIFNHPTGR